MGPGSVGPSPERLYTVQQLQVDWLEELPDGLLQQQVLQRLDAPERKALRRVDIRLRGLVNRLVNKAHVTAIDLQPVDATPTSPNSSRPASPCQLSPFASAAELQCSGPARLGNRFPCLQALSFADAGHVTIDEAQLWEFLGEGVQQLGRVTHLDFKRCHHVGQGLLGKLAGSCPSLVSLRPSRWTDSAALAQLARFSQLQALDLGDADVDVITVDDLGLASLVASGLPSLETLSLERCRWLSDAAFKSLGRLQGLRRLNLRHTDVAAGGLAALARLGHLEELNLSSCRLVDDAALAPLSASSTLQRLLLADTQVTNAGLAHCAAMPALSLLDLGGRFEVDDTGLSHLGRCRALRHLTAGSFNLDAGWEPASCSCSSYSSGSDLLGPGKEDQGGRGGGAKKLQPPLEHLSFGGAFANKGLQHLFPVPSLTSLHVQGMDSVTDALMHTLARQTSLERLSLRSGYSLTDRGLQALQALPHLREVTVSACPAISSACLGAVVRLQAHGGAREAPARSGGPGSSCAGAVGPMRRCSSY